MTTTNFISARTTSARQQPPGTGSHRILPSILVKMADNAPPIQHEDSIDSQDPTNAAKTKKVKSRRPASMQFLIHHRMEYGDGKTDL